MDGEDSGFEWSRMDKASIIGTLGERFVSVVS
jgi:hypothetical protein